MTNREMAEQIVGDVQAAVDGGQLSEAGKKYRDVMIATITAALDAKDAAIVARAKP